MELSNFTAKIVHAKLKQQFLGFWENKARAVEKCRLEIQMVYLMSSPSKPLNSIALLRTCALSRFYEYRKEFFAVVFQSNVKLYDNLLKLLEACK